MPEEQEPFVGEDGKTEQERSSRWRWRPISTAPKDGTRILVCRSPQWTPRQIIVAWGETHDGFGWIPWGDASDADFLGWMPIPAPPEAT